MNWILDLSYQDVYLFAATKKWHRPKVTGSPPGARDGHSACVISNRMYIFGGYEEGVSGVLIKYCLNAAAVCCILFQCPVFKSWYSITNFKVY